MRRQATTRLVFLITLLLSPVSARSTGADAPAEELSAARAVIAAAKYATLITLDEGGHPQARIMDPFPPEDDFTIWMATNRSTRKTRQIAADGRATLSYFDRQGVGYVTLLGRAELVADPEERARRFKDSWSGFYDDGPRGDDFVLIRFVPHRIEIVSIEHGVASGPKSWKPAIIDLPSSR